MSVWKFIVPHRDPSLLPRQWRIALGTQKSYKLDEAKKEKRRLYELKRRKQKADMANMQPAPDKEVCLFFKVGKYDIICSPMPSVVSDIGFFTFFKWVFTCLKS